MSAVGKEICCSGTNFVCANTGISTRNEQNNINKIIANSDPDFFARLSSEFKPGRKADCCSVPLIEGIHNLLIWHPAWNESATRQHHSNGSDHRRFCLCSFIKSLGASACSSCSSH